MNDANKARDESKKAEQASKERIIALNKMLEQVAGMCRVDACVFIVQLQSSMAHSFTHLLTHNLSQERNQAAKALADMRQKVRVRGGGEGVGVIEDIEYSGNIKMLTTLWFPLTLMAIERDVAKQLDGGEKGRTEARTDYG